MPYSVLHYLPAIDLEQGGVVRAVLDLCTLTQGQVMTFDIRDAPPDLAGVQLPGKPMKGGLLPSVALDRARLALQEVHFLHLHGTWDLAHIQLARLANQMGLPYGVSAHGMLDEWSLAQKSFKKKMFLFLFGKRLLNSAAWVHCTAEGEAAQVRRLLPHARVVVAPLAFDAREFETLPEKKPSDLPRILFLSRIHPKKGLEKLIAACALLQLRGKPVALGIAGSGEPRYVASLVLLARRHKIDVEFLGYLSGDEKVRVLVNADVFALPTAQENFGLALIEAMAASTPVITTKGVDIWPELQNAGAKILEVSANAEVWAEALLEMIENPKKQALGERGREWVLRELAPEKILVQYEMLYSQ